MEDQVKDVTIEDLGTVKKKLSFDIPWAEVKGELDKAYDVVGRTARVKGFRPGKIPRKMLELQYREEAEGEALTNLVSRHYEKAVRTYEIPVVSQPEIEQDGIEPEKNLSFTAVVEIRPDFEPRDYTGLSVTREEIEISESDVDDRIDGMRDRYATLEPLSEARPCAEGDYAVVDVDVSVDGTDREELKARDYTVRIGDNRFVDGFDEELAGLAAGEEKTFELSFPETYRPADLAGKRGVFRVVVKSLQEKNVPPLDDEFVKQFDAFETIEDLRQAVRQSMADETGRATEAEMRKNLIEQLLEKNPLEVPPVWVEHQVYQLLVDLQRRMMSSGLDRDRAAEMSWNMRDEIRPQAERMVKTSFLLGLIAGKESIAVEDGDIDDRLNAIAAAHGQTPESVREAFGNNGMERLRDELLEEKALSFLIESADITVKKTALAEAGKETA